MKIGIVGSGFVGATAGYALVMQGVGREIVLVDNNADRAEAEADDIRHAIRLRSAPVTTAIWKAVVSFCFVRASGRNPEKLASRFSSATRRFSVRWCRRY